MKYFLILSTLFLLGQTGSAYALTGNFTATLMSFDAPTEAVQSWLPPGTTLENDTDPVQKVFLFMGKQRNVAMIPPYNEIIVVVPNIHYQGHTYMYFPRLFLDNHQAVNWGVALYGFPKLYGEMENANGQFVLTSASAGRVLLDANVSVNEDAAIDVSTEQFAEVAALLSQPMLLNKNGRVLCSEFRMNLTEETLHPASVEVSIEDGFMKDLSQIAVSSGDLNQEAFGALHMIHAAWHVPSTGRTCP